MKSYRVDIEHLDDDSSSLMSYLYNTPGELWLGFPDGAIRHTFAFSSRSAREAFLEDVKDFPEILNLRTYEAEVSDGVEDVFPMEVKSEDHPKVLYHVTPYRNLKRILREGLVVGKGKAVLGAGCTDPYRGKRTYFTKTLSDAYVMAEDICEVISPYDEDTGRVVVILKVVLPKGVEVYEDWPCIDMVPAVYVKGRIPAKNIQLVEEYDPGIH